VGSASLVESFMLDDSNWQEMLLIGGVTFVGSLILTYLVRGYLKKRSKLDKVIIFILALICVVSILGVVVSFIMDVTTLGFEQFIEPKQFCE
jgi:multisubunit Na+/H+ antiporter MnhB subunit